jgi:hypothetical protein
MFSEPESRELASNFFAIVRALKTRLKRDIYLKENNRDSNIYIILTILQNNYMKYVVVIV